MACTYEEEIFQRTGRVDECGCSECPYKTLEECKEVEVVEFVEALPISAGLTVIVERD